MNQFFLNGINVKNIPKFRHFCTTLYKHRNILRPKNPKNRHEIHLDGIWTITEAGQNFLLYKSDNIIIFGTLEFLKRMCDSHHVFVDGTFSACPSLFYQLFTFHFLIGNCNFPALFCLLSDKKASTYIELLRVIIKLASDHSLIFEPNHVYCDFELAIFRAFSTVFTNIRIHGCYFHYSQSIYRNIQSIGLEILYKTDKSFHNFVKGLFILPLVPLDCLDAAFTVLQSSISITNPKIMQFLSYYKVTWINQNATFNRCNWSHCYNNICRTNNFVESFHAKLKKIIKVHKPNIFDLIKHLKLIQTSTEVSYQRMEIKDYQPSKKDKNIDDAVRKFNAKLLSLPELLSLLVINTS